MLFVEKLKRRPTVPSREATDSEAPPLIGAVGGALEVRALAVIVGRA